MNELLEHRGYQGTILYSVEDNLLYGKVIGIRGLISYEGETLTDLKKDFTEAIDDYLLACEQEGREPMKPYCGNLGDIQISPIIHRNLYVFAQKHDTTPSQAVENALKSYILS